MREREVILTISDGPSPDMQRKVNFLSKNNIPAVFFCVGALMKANPRPVISAIRKGYIIGNHTYTHPILAYHSIKNFAEEVEQTDELIEDMYGKAGVERERKVFSFPVGEIEKEKKREFVEFLKKKNYIVYKPDYKTEEWKELKFKKTSLSRLYHKTKKEIFQGVKANPSMIKLHDFLPSSKFFYKVVGMLKKRGFRFTSK